MKYLILGLSLLLSATIGAQNPVYSYSFNPLVQCDTLGGPALQTFGYVSSGTTQLQGSGKTFNTIYCYDTSGFAFTDAQDKIFGDSSYTIEIVARNLAINQGWAKLIDFKQGASDEGCYLLEGKMNFYAKAVGNSPAIVDGKYVYYSISRNAATKQVRLYANGALVTSFIDYNGAALPNASKQVTFFQDDTVTNGSEDNIALAAQLLFYDEVLADSVIEKRYLSFFPFVTSLNEASTANSVTLYPNPCSGDLYVTGAVGKSVAIFDMAGRSVFSSMLDEQHKINVAMLMPGCYIAKIDGASLIFNKR
jgi:hypothetical protein